VSTAPPRAERQLLRRARLRLALWSGGVTLVVLLVLGATVYGYVARQLAADSEEQLRARATLVAALKDPATDPAQAEVLKLVASAEKAGVLFGGPLSGTIAVIDERSTSKAGTVGGKGDGTLGLESTDAAKAKSVDVAKGPEKAAEGAVEEPLRPIDQIIDEALAQTGPRADGSEVSLKTIDGVPTRVLSFRGGTLEDPFLVHVLADRTTELGTLSSLATSLLVGGLLVVFAATLAGWAYSGRALVPIRASLRRQREFAADAGHELRTPLTVLRNNLEILARRPSDAGIEQSAIADATAETERMSRLVDDLLLLARTDADSAPIERAPLDLADVAVEAAEGLADAAAQRDIDLELDLSPTPLQGDADRLRQLVAILVDNAIRHGHAGGHAWVTVRAVDGASRLVVADDGPGISTDHRRRVFERFWRAPGTRASGSGLGLAIAQWIVDAHQGVIEVTEREGGGASFEVTVPG
jgi:signal transduction histidine kinase